MALQVNDWIWLRLSSRYGVTAAEAQLGDVFKRWLDETAQTWGYSLVDFYASKNVAGTTFGDGAYNYWSGGALQDAAFWIDAFSASGTSVTNLGSGGSALNARYGSTTGVDSADPVLLPHTGTNYLYLPGVASNTASVPSITAYDITGDIEVEVDAAYTTLTPASSSIILAREGADPNRAWAFYLVVDGRLGFRWYPTGSAASQVLKLSTATLQSVGIAAGQRVTVKVVLDVDNGAAGNDVKFYYSTDNGATFTQLGTTVTTAGVTSLPVVTQPIIFNSSLGGTELDAKIYRGIVRNGIGGTAVFDANFTTGITSGSQTTFTESSVNAATVTINRAVSGRKSVAVTRPVWLFGTDDYMEVTQDPYTAYVQTVGTSAAATATYTAYDTGTATAGAATTLDDTTKAWTAGVYISRVVRITGGTGVGQVRVITAQTATQLTVTPAWTTIPDATSTYVIESRGNVNGDLEIVTRVAFDNWANGFNQPLIAKRAIGQYSYYAYMAATGNIALSCSFDGTTAPVTFGSAVAPFTNGTTYWIRIRRTASTGVVTADYAADQATEPSSWTTLSSSTLTAGTIWQGSADVGVAGTAVSGYANGKYYTVIVRDGFGGNTAVYWQACGHPAGGNYVNANKVLWTKGATATVVNSHPMNFAANSPFTVVSVQRSWATPPASGTIVSKWSGGGGWNARNGFGTPTQPLIALNDNNTSQAFASPITTNGNISILTWVVEPTQVTTYLGNTAVSPVARTVFESAASETPVRIGATAGGGSYNDFELLAVAVIPKALTAAEIARIVAAYQ